MCCQTCNCRTSITRRTRRGKRHGDDSSVLQRRYLILHQCNERRYDERRTPGQQCRDLVTDRFAGSRRKDRQDIPAGNDGLDDICLAGTK